MYNYSNFRKNQKAIALGYDKNKDDAPKVLASGNGLLAEKIIAIAKEHNIPLHQNADLAEILSFLDIEESIPIEVYEIVAKIFTHIYQQYQTKL